MEFCRLIGWITLCSFACCVLASGDYQSSFRCGENKFKCASQKCITTDWRCDGDDDCGDGSDEIGCTSPKLCIIGKEFRCDNMLKCIPDRWKCDHEKDCSDGSDEKNCTKRICEKNFFQCTNNRCIPNKWRCDGADDCGDKSDETNCTLTTRKCRSDEFTCSDGSCIYSLWKCDGNQDCGDRSDEKDCGKVVRRSCSPTEYSCESQCIPKPWRCDGSEDCRSGEDEKNCTTTPAPKTCVAGQWTCNDGGCINGVWHCDGENDCRDNSDEKQCVTVRCASSKFACANRKQCIFSTYRCNGEHDCDDGSDEVGCPKRETLCTGNHFNCSDGTCIDTRKLCDLHNDCPYGEDEPVSCFINECQSQRGHCMHHCVDLKIGYKCTCHNGFKLDDDSRSCLDVNECNIYGTCHQKCTNTKGSYKCSCADGYKLEPDQKACKVTGVEPVIYFSNRRDIRTLTKDGQYYEVAVSHLKGVVSFDFHVKQNFIYMADAIDESIKRAVIGQPNSTKVILRNIHTPDGFAVDWVTGKLYWTDTGYKTIEVADVDGKYNTDLLLVGLSEPRAIALDPFFGYLYWTDWGKSPAIERISMDGNLNTRVKLVQTGIVWPNGLTLDLAQRRMYWIDAKLRHVEVSDLFGQNRRIITNQGIIHPFALDNFEEMLYWTDWRLDVVRSLDKFDTRNMNTLRRSLDAPMDIKIYHPTKQPEAHNPCSTNNNGCSHLCLLANSVGRRQVVCKCPRNMNLHHDKKNCIGTAVTRGPLATKSTKLQTPTASTEGMQRTRYVTTTRSTKSYTKQAKKLIRATVSPKISRTRTLSVKTKRPRIKASHPLITTRSTNRPSVHIEGKAPFREGGSKSLSSGVVAGIVIVFIVVILLVAAVVVYCRRRGLGKRHVMYYKDLSKTPLEEDFDPNPEEIQEKAKIVSEE